MTWRDTVRGAFERFGVVDDVRRLRHAVRSRGGRSDRALIADHLASSEDPRLHFGCGTRCLDGWLNADLSPRTNESIRLDATEPLPFPDETFAYVYSEHMIEHVDYLDGRGLLSEWLRVLRPGGRLRVSTPDLERLLALFAGRDGWTEDERRYAELIAERHVSGVSAEDVRAAHVLNNNVRDWGHRFLYDGSTLESLLAEVGFVDVVRCGLQSSDDPVLRGLANDSRMPPGLVDFETMTYEATRP